MNILHVKLLSLFLIAVIVLNLILFIIGIVSDTTFWVVIVAGAISAYYILPRLRKASH